MRTREHKRLRPCRRSTYWCSPGFVDTRFASDPMVFGGIWIAHRLGKLPDGPARGPFSRGSVHTLLCCLLFTRFLELCQTQISRCRVQADPMAKEIGVSDRTYYRWRREYGRIRADQDSRVKMLEKDRPKKLVSVEPVAHSLTNAVVVTTDDAQRRGQSCAFRFRSDAETELLLLRRAAPRAAVIRYRLPMGKDGIAVVSDPKQAAKRRRAATGEPAPHRKTRDLSDPVHVAAARCKSDRPPADPAAWRPPTRKCAPSIDSGVAPAHPDR